MKNILITGASGWLGINLIKTFIKGIDLYPETHNLNENSSINVFIPKSEHSKLFNLFGDKVNYFYGDIRNKGDCKKSTKLFLDFFNDLVRVSSIPYQTGFGKELTKPLPNH